MHPRNDISGEKCSVNQSGPVWFLDVPISSEVVTKTLKCEIPQGRAIFVPLLVGECDTAEVESLNDVELTKCAKQGNDGGNIRLSIDGNNLLMINGTSQNEKDYSLYRTTSDYFDIYWTESNYFEAPAGTYRAIADGYFVIINPLPIGNHQIDLRTIVYNPLIIENDLVVDITYDIKIVSSQNS